MSEVFVRILGQERLLGLVLAITAFGCTQPVPSTDPGSITDSGIGGAGGSSSAGDSSGAGGCKQKFPPSASLPCPIPNPGQQYYVDVNAGDDSASGTSPTEAWATLSRAIEMTPEGSTLNVAEGDYGSEAVDLAKGIVVKGGYDGKFWDWNPDTHPTYYHGRLTMEHNAAVFGGFKMIAEVNVKEFDELGHVQHSVWAGTLVRNYIEVVGVGDDDSDPSLYAIDASSDAGDVSVVQCNDIYVRLNHPRGFSVAAITYGNSEPHYGAAVVDSNRICVDKGSMSESSTVLDGYGTCSPAVVPASLVVKNNVLESAAWFGTATDFYACDIDMDLTFTNNTILTRGDGIFGEDIAPRVLHWRLTNNILFSMVQASGSDAISLGSEGSVIESAEGNLTFGYANDSIYPAPLIASNNDVDAGSPSTVFTDAANGIFTLRAGGLGIGTGVNVYDDPAYGSVTTDIAQKPRQDAGSWDRGAFLP